MAKETFEKMLSSPNAPRLLLDSVLEEGVMVPSELVELTQEVIRMVWEKSLGEEPAIVSIVFKERILEGEAAEYEAEGGAAGAYNRSLREIWFGMDKIRGLRTEGWPLATRLVFVAAHQAAHAVQHKRAEIEGVYYHVLDEEEAWSTSIEVLGALYPEKVLRIISHLNRLYPDKLPLQVIDRRNPLYSGQGVYSSCVTVELRALLETLQNDPVVQDTAVSEALSPTQEGGNAAEEPSGKKRGRSKKRTS